MVATCDPNVGCRESPVDDGTPCGPDDCRSTTTDICLAGRCVPRARPAENACSRRWVPLELVPRSGSGLTWDEARERLVLFGGGQLDETWEREGSVWRQRFPATSPVARSGHGLAYDPLRRRVVLFGGVSLTPAYHHPSDTWEWDGASWLRIPARTTPPRCSDCQLTWDGNRRRVVLMAFDHVWEWDGVDWFERAERLPRGRYEAALAWDSTRARVMLFGGRADSTASSALDDLWAWDGSTWSQVTTPNGPSARWGHSMAFDTHREALVVTGGSGQGAAPAPGVWEWNGVRWASTATGPHVNVRAPMAYDAARRRTVQSRESTGVWEWDGASWTNTSKPSPFPASDDGAITTDTVRRRVVLVMLGSTWEWTGTGWEERVTPVAPEPRREHGLAFDPVRRRVVLFGGRGQTPLADTWEWDGQTWLERTPQTSPPAGGHALMAFDHVTSRVMLVVGQQTWAWDGSVWAELAAAPGGFSLSTDPHTGRPVLMNLRTNNALEAWAWDGAQWALRGSTQVWGVGWPSGTMDLDQRRLVVLARSGNLTSRTFEFDGTAWAAPTVVGPRGYAVPAMTWEPHFGRVLAVTSHNASLYVP